MITIKSYEEIGKMRKAGALLHAVHEQLRALIEPGITTAYLDKVARKLIEDAGAIPSFLGYQGYPYTLCTSVDDQVVHGFPTDTPLKEGQLLSVDAGLILDGFQSDSAFSAPVGKADPEVMRLIRVTEECFWLAANQAREGNRLGDISHAVQEYAERFGYGVIRDYVGHGVGAKLHEPPEVPNYGKPGHGPRLAAGQTIAVEPMVSAGTYEVRVLDNDWTVVTADGSLSAHYENSILITDGEPEILTIADDI